MKRILLLIILLPAIAMADFGSDAAKAVDILSKTATKTVQKVSDTEKSGAGEKESTAKQAIDSLLKSCDYNALTPVLNVQGYEGVQYRGLVIAGFYAADGGAGSDWGITFKNSVKEVEMAIPEAKKQKSFKDKSNPALIILSIQEDYHVKGQSQLNCYQNIGGGSD